MSIHASPLPWEGTLLCSSGYDRKTPRARGMMVPAMPLLRAGTLLCSSGYDRNTRLARGMSMSATPLSEAGTFPCSSGYGRKTRRARGIPLRVSVLISIGPSSARMVGLTFPYCNGCGQRSRYAHCTTSSAQMRPHLGNLTCSSGCGRKTARGTGK